MRHVLALLLVPTFLLTGCEALEALNKGADALNESLNNPDDGYNVVRRNKFPDQQIATAFMDQAGKLVPELGGSKSYLYLSLNNQYTDFLAIERAQGKGHSYDTVLAARLAADSSRDDIAQLYIRTAHARGNSVRLYKQPINASIEKQVGIVVKPERSNTRYYGNMDNALIEFDATGRMVSALTRQVGLELGAMTSGFADSENYYLYERSAIWTSRTIRAIEGSLRNDLLASYFLTELKPAQAPPQAALPAASSPPPAPIIVAPAAPATFTAGQIAAVRAAGGKLYPGGTAPTETLAPGAALQLISTTQNAGATWWYVDSSGRRGYVQEVDLIPVASR